MEIEREIDTARTNQYIRLENTGGRYYHLQQSPIILFWILFFKKDPLRTTTWQESSSFSIRSFIGGIRHRCRIFRKRVYILIKFIEYKYQLRTRGKVVSLPFSGQICLQVHNGFKVFDLRNGVVIKAFDSDVESPAIEKEVNMLRNISAIPFAPSIRRWNVEEKWYEEGYADGAMDTLLKPLDSQNLLRKFQRQLIPRLKSIVLFQEPKEVNAAEYSKELVLNLYDKVFKRGDLRKGESKNIHTFIWAIGEKLQNEGPYLVQLVFTHGDFCPANMLSVKGGLFVVDWESATYRSALFDFYSYFFHRPAIRGIPIVNVVYEIQKGLPMLITSLKQQIPGVSESILKMEKIYRWLFYLELISRLAERELNDKKLDIYSYVVSYINAFEKYEKVVRTGPKVR